MMAIAGISATLVRILEPFVIKTLFGLINCGKKGDKIKYSDTSLHSFVNSVMNIELVCVTLEGISECFKEESVSYFDI